MTALRRIFDWMRNGTVTMQSSAWALTIVLALVIGSLLGQYQVLSTAPAPSVGECRR